MENSSSFIRADKEAREAAKKEQGINKGRPGVAKETKDQITTMYNNGRPLKEIAGTFNVSLSTVCKVIRERKK